MSFKMSMRSCMESLVTLYFCLFLLMGSSAKDLHRLSLISACSMRHSPSSTSMAVYMTRFSRPRSRSRLRKPMSASTSTTRYPRRAMDIPRLALVVVLPTPPLPEVITITRASSPVPLPGSASAATHSVRARLEEAPTRPFNAPTLPWLDALPARGSRIEPPNEAGEEHRDNTRVAPSGPAAAAAAADRPDALRTPRTPLHAAWAGAAAAHIDPREDFATCCCVWECFPVDRRS
mmetsp:Transcript_1503/g.3412  ORF Transcript_1503/g.3412 Transcript_1503/m.3412 type:complete len:234 (+) Transcript_1503:684-1385(+)